MNKSTAKPFSFENVRTWVLLTSIIVLLGGIYLGLGSQAAIIGKRVLALQQQLERLGRENAQLEFEIAQLTTPERILSRAPILRLRPAKPEQIKYIVVKDYPIEPPKAASMPKAQSAAVSTASRPFNLLAWLNDLLARVGLVPSPRAVEATTNP